MNFLGRDGFLPVAESAVEDAFAAEQLGPGNTLTDVVLDTGKPIPDIVVEDRKEEWFKVIPWCWLVGNAFRSVDALGVNRGGPRFQNWVLIPF